MSNLAAGWRYVRQVGGALALAGAACACQSGPPPPPPADSWLMTRLLDPGPGRTADERRLRAALAAPAPPAQRFRQLRRLSIYLSHSATPDSGAGLLRAAARLGTVLHPPLPLELANIHSRLARLHWRHQHYDSARLASLKAAQVLAAAFPDSAAWATFRTLDGRAGAVGVSLASNYANAGLAWRAEGRLPAALHCYDLARRAYQCAPNTAPQKLGGLAWVHTLYAEALQEQDEPALAAGHYEQALAVLRTQRRYNWADAMQEWAATLPGYAPHLLPTAPHYLRALATEEQPELRRRLQAHPRDRDLLTYASTLALVEAQACLVAQDSATTRVLARAATLLPRLRQAAGPEFRVELGYYGLAAQLTQLQAGWAQATGQPTAAHYATRTQAYYDSAGAFASRTRLGMALAREWLRQRNYPAAATLLRPLSRHYAQAQEPQALSQALYLLAGAYARQGRYDSAFQAQGRAVALADTLRGRQQRAAVAEAEARFRSSLQALRIWELTQAEARQQHQKQVAWLGAGLLLLLLGGATAALLVARRLAGRLRAARATQNRLYTVIGHDLRTPLTALEGLATLLDYYSQPALASSGDLREVAAEVRHTTGRLTGLLNNLLYWAASQSGELAYQPEALDAAALLHESAALYAPAAHARQVAVAVEVPPGLPALWADYNMVLTQLRNLLGNALKAAPPGSAITLAARPGQGGLVLAVADAGPGLSAAQRSALQAGPGPSGLSPRQPGQRGTGLGLPLVRQLAQRQQGGFWLESGPGPGTTACLLLPLAPAG
ncbi:MAG: ATP-binding protein [Janthinobacterium lividum]